MQALMYLLDFINYVWKILKGRYQ